MNPFQHFNLLSRFSRSEALRELVFEQVGEGDRVLDAGCGIGLLSLWAARAGAKKVVGVDLGDLELATQLAVENEVDDVVRFLRGDLWKIDLRQEAPFDVLLAMVYLNDPRRDESQTRMVFHLKKNYLKPSTIMIPGEVEYLAIPSDWPAQRFPDRMAQFENKVQEMEGRYDLRLQHFVSALAHNPSKEAFPARLPTGALERDGAVPLGRPCPWMTVDYQDEEAAYPGRLQLAIEKPGELTSVVWMQNLKFNGRTIFSNESVSWLDRPVHVQAGQQVTLKTDERWKQDNLLTEV